MDQQAAKRGNTPPAVDLMGKIGLMLA